LVAEAIDLCRDIFEHVQSQSVASPP
jgi:hypothetical protein